jgi:hypothetical protein
MTGLASTAGDSSPVLAEFARALAPVHRAPGHIALRPDDVKNGLGKLVLTLVELLRELLERQAIRRMDAGSLTDIEVERLGTTFMQLAEQVEALKTLFGISGEELNLDLGPLGKLI